MKTTLLFFCFLGFYFSACSEEPEKNENTADKSALKDSAEVILMTQQTELKSAEYLTSEIKVPGIICKMCEKNISSSVKKLNGIIEVNANHKMKTVLVKFDGGKISLDKIRKSISNAGYDADNVKRDSAAYESLDECCKIKNTTKS